MRVLLVDDSVVFLDVLTAFLRRHHNIHIVGVANNVAQGATLAALAQPELILLDLAMPDGSGLELLPRLRVLCPQARIIVLTLFDHRETVLSSGADDCVSKDRLSTDLFPAIEHVMNANESLDHHQ